MVVPPSQSSHNPKIIDMTTSSERRQRPAAAAAGDNEGEKLLRGSADLRLAEIFHRYT